MAKRKMADTLPARDAGAEYGMGAWIAILKGWAATLTDEQRKEAWEIAKAALVEMGWDGDEAAL